MSHNRELKERLGTWVVPTGYAPTNENSWIALFVCLFVCCCRRDIIFVKIFTPALENILGGTTVPHHSLLSTTDVWKANWQADVAFPLSLSSLSSVVSQVSANLTLTRECYRDVVTAEMCLTINLMQLQYQCTSILFADGFLKQKKRPRKSKLVHDIAFTYIAK